MRSVALLLLLAGPLVGCVVEDSPEDTTLDASTTAPPDLRDGGGEDRGHSTDGAVRTDASTAGDARPALDAAQPTDAASAPDAETQCSQPDPRLPGCVDAADCSPGEECAVDPHFCRPTGCACYDDSFWDCRPGPADGSSCEKRSACSLRAISCVGDFDCHDGFCDDGLCRRICLGQHQPVMCGAVPPPCAIGQTVVPKNTCYACVDARTCTDQPPQSPCAGSTLDGAGVCRAADGASRPEHCCRFNLEPLTHGARASHCALDGAPALRVDVSVDERLDQACERVPQGLYLRLWLRDGLPAYRQTVLLGPGAAAGFAELCVAPDQCEAQRSARLLRTGGFGDDFEGNLEVTWLDGSVSQTVVRWFGTCRAPVAGCQ